MHDVKLLKHTALSNRHMQLFKPRAMVLRNLACLLPERKFDLNLVSYVFLKSVKTHSLRRRMLARARVVRNTKLNTTSGFVSAV